jgi:cellulase/cellobiase CelA1
VKWRVPLAVSAALVVVAAVCGLLASAGLASAASLGGVTSASLSATETDTPRCDDQVTYALLGSVTGVRVTDVAAGCAGAAVQAVVIRADGAVLASATGTANAGAFDLTLSATVDAAKVDGLRITFGGLEIPAVAAAPSNPVTSTVTITSDWGAGYCAEVTVSTTSATPVTWTSVVDLASYPVNGVPNNVWRASYSLAGATMTAVGLSYDATVVAGAPETYGYCADRPTPPPGAVTYATHVDSDWGSGYCATVTITTTSTAPVTWQVGVSLATAPVNGTPYDVWNATTTFAHQVLTASGVGWNSSVKAGSPATFGFCANR